MKKTIKEYIAAGLKWTITPAQNDRTGERLGFVPFELNSKMTASAFLAQYQRENGGELVAVRPLNIARAAFAVCPLITTYGGKVAAKVTAIVSDEKIITAVNATDDAAAEVQKRNTDLRRATAQAERAALLGVSPEKMANERAALDAFRKELDDAKTKAQLARKSENDLCAAKVAELFPAFNDEINTNN